MRIKEFADLIRFHYWLLHLHDKEFEWFRWLKICQGTEENAASFDRTSPTAQWSTTGPLVWRIGSTGLETHPRCRHLASCSSHRSWTNAWDSQQLQYCEQRPKDTNARNVVKESSVTPAVPRHCQRALKWLHISTYVYHCLPNPTSEHTVQVTCPPLQPSWPMLAAGPTVLVSRPAVRMRQPPQRRISSQVLSKGPRSWLEKPSEFRKFCCTPDSALCQVTFDWRLTAVKTSDFFLSQQWVKANREFAWVHRHEKRAVMHPTKEVCVIAARIWGQTRYSAAESLQLRAAKQAKASHTLTQELLWSSWSVWLVPCLRSCLPVKMWRFQLKMPLVRSFFSLTTNLKITP